MQTTSILCLLQRKSGHPRRLLLAVLAGCLATSTVAAASSFRVGSFTKSTAAAPASQAIAHGLGETPRALILWTGGRTTESFSTDFRFALGFTDGTTDRALAAASRDGLEDSDASRRLAAKALTIVQWSEALLAEADLTSWDSTDFTLNWTTNNATAYVIHYLAIGGGVSARVVDWTTRESPGSQSVATVGFAPDLVIHAHVGGFTSAIPASVAVAGVGLGVMTADGDEWALATLSRDASERSDTQRYQQTDACLVVINTDQLVDKEASFVSMDGDGFTVDFSTAEAGAYRVLSLALRGLEANAGSFSKATAAAPASQAVTGVGFRPRALLLSSFQGIAQASPVAHARFGLGATDGTTEGSSAFQDSNGAEPASVDGIDKTSKLFLKVDNATPSIDAEADLTSLDSDGFTLRWSGNDAVAAELLYLALGAQRRIMFVD